GFAARPSRSLVPIGDTIRPAWCAPSNHGPVRAMVRACSGRWVGRLRLELLPAWLRYLVQRWQARLLAVVRLLRNRTRLRSRSRSRVLLLQRVRPSLLYAVTW